MNGIYSWFLALLSVPLLVTGVLAQNEIRNLLQSRKRSRKPREDAPEAKKEDRKTFDSILLDSAFLELFGHPPHYAEKEAADKEKRKRRKSKLLHIPDQPETFVLACRQLRNVMGMTIKVYRSDFDPPEGLDFRYVGDFNIDNIDSIEGHLRDAFGSGEYITNFTDSRGLIWAQYRFCIL